MIPVLLCSPPAFPDAVAAQMRRARKVRAALDHATAGVILEPLHEGIVRGVSHALVPHCRPLARRWPQKIMQRRMLLPALLEWLRSVKRQSLCAVAPHEAALRFGKPLLHVAAEPALDPRIRSAAAQAVTRLHRGAWVPHHALMHGDLWEGNVLLRSCPRSPHSRPRRRSFALIDWGSAELRGHGGIYDLVRLAQSFRLSDHRLRLEIDSLCQLLQCDPIDARSHLLAALGHIGMNRGCMPLQNYAQLANACMDAIERTERDRARQLVLPAWRKRSLAAVSRK